MVFFDRKQIEEERVVLVEIMVMGGCIVRVTMQTLTESIVVEVVVAWLVADLKRKRDSRGLSRCYCVVIYMITQPPPGEPAISYAVSFDLKVYVGGIGE